MYDKDHADKYSTLKIPKELHTRIKVCAAQRQCSMITLLSTLITEQSKNSASNKISSI